ncbi:hypothetical protein EON63_12220 [archaeon]|nr:MAG: hypothetical protein EON63_12220 [archaeon]
MTLLITGQINGYTEGSACSIYHHDWTCLFEPSSECHYDLMWLGREVAYDRNIVYHDEPMVPDAFKQYGYAYWWGVIQLYLFNFNEDITQEIASRLEQLNFYTHFPYPLAAMHVRHGDKHVDGFHEHSMSSEMLAIQSSPDCPVQNSQGLCFYPVLSNVMSAAQDYYYAYLLLHSILSGDSAGTSGNTGRVVRKSEINNPLSSASVLTTTSGTSDPLVQQLRVYVASDDARVLQDAKKLGFYTAPALSISTATGNVGKTVNIISNHHAPYTIIVLRTIHVCITYQTPIFMLQYATFKPQHARKTRYGALPVCES